MNVKMNSILFSYPIPHAYGLLTLIQIMDPVWPDWAIFEKMGNFLGHF